MSAPETIRLLNQDLPLARKDGRIHITVEIVVDEQDEELLRSAPWRIGDLGYLVTGAYRNGEKVAGKRYFHREVLPTEAPLQVDHRDLNKLNNSRRNLRQCTASQNRCNKRSNVPGKLKGVRKDGNRYRAVITANYRQVKLGSFKTLEEAQAAYVKAAIEYHGEFARFD